MYTPSGAQLVYFIDDVVSTVSCSYWVKFPTLPSIAVLYISYGNTLSVGDPHAVFEAYTNFSNGMTSNTIAKAPAVINAADGYVSNTTTSTSVAYGGGYGVLFSAQTASNPLGIETKTVMPIDNVVEASISGLMNAGVGPIISLYTRSITTAGVEMGVQAAYDPRPSRGSGNWQSCPWRCVSSPSSYVNLATQNFVSLTSVASVPELLPNPAASWRNATIVSTGGVFTSYRDGVLMSSFTNANSAYNTPGVSGVTVAYGGTCFMRMFRVYKSSASVITTNVSYNIKCPAGMTVNATSLNCVQCAVGTFAEYGIDVCLPCPAGSVSSTAGAVACMKCPASTYQDLSGQSVCKLCPGELDSFLGSTDVSNCNMTRNCMPGTYTSSTGVTTCTACPAGSYQTSSNADTCVPCAAGTYKSTVGAGVCSQCSVVGGRNNCLWYGSVHDEDWNTTINARNNITSVGAGNPGTFFASSSTSTLSFNCPSGSFSPTPTTSVRLTDGMGEWRRYSGTDGTYLSNSVFCNLNAPCASFSSAYYTSTSDFSSTPSKVYDLVLGPLSVPSTGTLSGIRQFMKFDFGVDVRRYVDTIAWFERRSPPGSWRRYSSSGISFYVGDIDVPFQSVSSPNPPSLATSGNSLCYTDIGDAMNSYRFPMVFPCQRSGRFLYVETGDVKLGITLEEMVVLGSPVCTQCTPGTYSYNVIPTAKCSQCPNGTFQTGVGSSFCNNCHVNSTSLPDKTRCLCNAGFSGNGTLCTLCDAGYYGNGLACLRCTVCDPNVTTVTTCLPGSSSDTVSCACNAGYYGNGVTCSKCSVCNSNATFITTCAVGSSYDAVSCVCNVGYYGDGYRCSVCATCSANAVQVVDCPANSTTDTTTCACNAGYYGDGFRCVPCASCGANAFQSVGCDVNSLRDVSACTCNAGYYGNISNGVMTCVACRQCGANASALTTCGIGAAVDTTTCGCVAGYFGDGNNCTMCRQCGLRGVLSVGCSSNSVVDTSRCVCSLGYVGDGYTCVRPTSSAKVVTTTAAKTISRTGVVSTVAIGSAVRSGISTTSRVSTTPPSSTATTANPVSTTTAATTALPVPSTKVVVTNLNINNRTVYCEDVAASVSFVNQAFVSAASVSVSDIKTIVVQMNVTDTAGVVTAYGCVNSVCTGCVSRPAGNAGARRLLSSVPATTTLVTVSGASSGGSQPALVVPASSSLVSPSLGITSASVIPNVPGDVNNPSYDASYYNTQVVIVQSSGGDTVTIVVVLLASLAAVALVVLVVVVRRRSVVVVVREVSKAVPLTTASRDTTSRYNTPFPTHERAYLSAKEHYEMRLPLLGDLHVD